MMADFSDLVGLTLTKVEVSDCELRLFAGKRTFRLYHHQDCCEDVELVDIEGDILDLLNKPLIHAEVAESQDRHEGRPVRADDAWSESFTWTFYRLATEKGFVVFRWLGESNGYYSESVDFEEITEKE